MGIIIYFFQMQKFSINILFALSVAAEYQQFNVVEDGTSFAKYFKS